MENNELFPDNTMPEKWYVERNKHNCALVNKMFSILYKRKYTDNGVMRYHYNGEWHTRDQDYMHYPRINRTSSKNSKTCVFTKPQKGYKEISVEQLERFVINQDLKDNWYIKGSIELYRYLQTQKNGITWVHDEFGYYINEHGKWDGQYIDKLSPYKFKITLERFLNHKNNSMKASNTRPILGYKLKRSEYREAVKAIINADAWARSNDWFNKHFDTNLREKGFNFANTPANIICNVIKTANVLDIWFEPVYEELPQLPQIRGNDGILYNGILENGKLIYGCAKLSVEWFKGTENRHIINFTTNNGVLVGVEEVKAIRKYLERHGWSK